MSYTDTKFRKSSDVSTSKFLSGCNFKDNTLNADLISELEASWNMHFKSEYHHPIKNNQGVKSIMFSYLWYVQKIVKIYFYRIYNIKHLQLFRVPSQSVFYTQGTECKDETYVAFPVQ